MSSEECLKRKSADLESNNAEETVNEPQMKVQKIDNQTSEANLKNDDVCKTQESNLNETLPLNTVETCVEGSNVDVDVEISAFNVENNLTLNLTENEPVKSAEEQKKPEQKVEECMEKKNLEIPQTCPGSISIKFHNQTIWDKYKSKILKFLDSFIEFQVQNRDDFSLEIYIDPNDRVIPEDSPQTSSSKKKHRRHAKAKKELFVVDSTPSRTTTKTDLRYTTKFTISTEKDKESDQNAERGAKQACFNCGQFHFIKDCPLPKDYNRINTARQKLFRPQSKGRYHIDEEQKYSHLAPGKISNELRKALGLYKNEAPHFIYLMRNMGYPPGWLEEAKFVHSDLEMFDIDGKFVKAISGKKRGLDPAKIVDYPGFNVPFEKGIKDEYRKYGVPPFSEDFSKDAMVHFYEKKFAQEEDNLETCDMDIEQETSSSQEKPAKEECRDSPSLLDLEEQKKQLLNELKDEVKEEKSDFFAVKTTHFGTPILKSNSPYMTLPDPDKFSKDVSPVINFENLPNSTGKYEQMTDVLQKVRSTLKKIQQKCDT